VKGGKLNLRNAQYRADPDPLVADCACYTCAQFSRAYLRHLVMANEILAHILLTTHNVHFLCLVNGRCRQAPGHRLQFDGQQQHG
jgi:queuine tRNA-ribosyltransferase